jgi:hypothetical protein
MRAVAEPFQFLGFALVVVRQEKHQRLHPPALDWLRNGSPPVPGIGFDPTLPSSRPADVCFRGSGVFADGSGVLPCASDVVYMPADDWISRSDLLNPPADDCILSSDVFYMLNYDCVFVSDLS